MSQIDQAFIKAYRQQRAVTNAPAETEGTAFQRASVGGQQLRVDAPHVNANTPAAPATQRIPTPHLQVPSDVAPQLGNLTSQPATATPNNATQRWSTSFHKRSRIRPNAPNSPIAEPPVQPTPQVVEETTYTSVEETLLRLVGLADQDGKPQEEEVITVPLNVSAVEVQAASDSEECAESNHGSAEPVATDVEEKAVEVTPEEAEIADSSPTVTEEHCAKPTVESVVQVEKEATSTTVGAPPAEQDVAEETTEQATAHSFQPAWEVDNFQWPEVVTRLETDPIAGVSTASAALAGTIGVSNKMLAVAGVDEKVGTTTLSLLLARGLAKQGLSVALVDADFEHPSLAESLGVRIQDGWEAAIDGRLPLEEVCVASVSDGVTLVPLVQDTKISATSASLAAAELLKQLCSEFDFVLIDAGSGSESVAAMATGSDEVLDVSVLLAVDERSNTEALTQEIIARLKQFSINSIQLAQTFVAA